MKSQFKKLQKMKKIALILFLLAFQFQASAQPDIDVVITGDCSPFSGTYQFNGLVNGKNNYVQTFLVSNEPQIVAVGFDSSKWVLYGNGDVTDFGFSNIAVPEGNLPPYLGWVNTQCESGTMTINPTLAVADFNHFERNTAIFPNPAQDYLTISEINSSSNPLEYDIIDMMGRIVLNGTSQDNNHIAVQNLQSGHYIVKIKNKAGQVSNKQLVKI